MQDRSGYGNRIFQKAAEKAYRRQLQRITKAVAVAPLGGDPLAVLVVQMEVARQLLAGKRYWIAAIALAVASPRSL